MQVGILGPLVVLAEGRMAQIGGSRLRVLLVRLSLDPGHLVTIDALASALWPAGGPAERHPDAGLTPAPCAAAKPDPAVVSRRLLARRAAGCGGCRAVRAPRARGPSRAARR